VSSILNQPLSRSQHALRERKIIDMDDTQLINWINACEKMEAWSGISAKARRGWKKSRASALLEIDRRALLRNSVVADGK
jgi:hypothetical protein